MAELFDTQEVTSALDLLSPASPPDVEGALARQRSLQARDRFTTGPARHAGRSSFMTTVHSPFAVLRRPAWAAPAAAAALAVMVLLTPPGHSLAGQFLTIVRVQSFQPITLSAARGAALAGIPDLTRFGDMSPSTSLRPELRAVPDSSAATAAVGFPIKAPGSLPAGIDRVPSRVEVTSPQAVTFTFSADKTRAYLDSIGRKDFALPAKLDGASIRVNVPAAAVMVFSAPGAVAPSSPMTDTVDPGDRGTALSAALNSVTVVEGRAPSVEASGVSFEELRDFLLSLPGLPADTAAQIRSIGDLTTTLPVPIPSGASARKVQVNGAPGLIVAEQTSRLAGGVVWQADGLLYAVGGPLNESDLMSIAGSLR